MEKESSSLTNGTTKHCNSYRKEYKIRKTVTSNLKNVIMENLLLFTTILGVALGFIVGFAVREAHPSENARMWLGLPGQLYLRLLKMMIVPLIACSVICGAAALDPKANGKISLIAFIFITSTNALGSALGIGSVYMFSAGKGEMGNHESDVEGTMNAQDILADLIRNVVPDNLFAATFSQTRTAYKMIPKTTDIPVNGSASNGTLTQTTEVKRYLTKGGNANIIGLIFACTLLGLAAAKLKSKGKPFLDVVQSVSDTVITVVRWCMWTTPIGVVSLIAVSVAGIDSVNDVFAHLGLFIAAITLGILSQQLVFMSAIFFTVTRRNPYKYLISITKPWMIGFASTSTAVAIPEMMSACEESNNIDKRISRFVIPFSVTISCNGSALYIAGASCFIANLTGTQLTLGDVLMIWILVTVSAMAIPSVPSASIMTTVMVLSSMSIPVDDIALLLAIEWYLDRIRTTSSVVSHTFCTAVVYSLCKKDLDEVDHERTLHHNETEITIADYDEDATVEGIEATNGKLTNGFNNGSLQRHSSGASADSIV